MRFGVENTDRKTVQRFYAFTNTYVPYAVIHRTVNVKTLVGAAVAERARDIIGTDDRDLL